MPAGLCEFTVLAIAVGASSVRPRFEGLDTGALNPSAEVALTRWAGLDGVLSGTRNITIVSHRIEVP